MSPVTAPRRCQRASAPAPVDEATWRSAPRNSSPAWVSRLLQPSSVVVADTGAILALLDSDDVHHATLRAMFVAEPQSWILPWAILPEVDYLVASRLGPSVHRSW